MTRMKSQSVSGCAGLRKEKPRWSRDRGGERKWEGEEGESRR